LDRVARLLAARTTGPAFLVVEGEPGIGKTRMLAEIADRARAGGRQVRTGCTTEYEQSTPFALVYDAFPATLAGAANDPNTGRAERRHRRYRAIRDELARAGRALLALDDVQWADRASLELLVYLVRHPPRAAVLIALAYRSSQCPPALHRELGRAGPGVHWMSLAPLRAADIDELFPTEPAEHRLLLHLASGGNPLYLGILRDAPRAVLAGLDDARPVLDSRVVTALDRTITAELGALGEPERLVARSAALLGDDFDLEILAPVAEVTSATAAATVDRLVARDVLRVREGRLMFRHPLVRTAAYRLAGPGWRTEAHRRAAEHLARYGASPVRLAPHLEQAARFGDEAAAEVLAEAAHAMLNTAPTTSVEWVRTALRILPERPSLVRYRAGLRLLLAKALVLSGQFAAGEAELGDLSGLTGRTRPAAVRLLAMTARLLGRSSEASALARAELARSSTARATTSLRFEMVAAELLTGRWERATAAASALVREIGVGHPGEAAAASALDALAAVPSGGSLGAVLARLERTRLQVDGLDDGALRDVLDAVVPLSWLELLVDQTDHAVRHLDRGANLARRYGRMHLLPQLYPIRAMATSMRGRVAESLHDATEAAETARLVGSSEMIAFALAVRLRPLWWTDGPAAARATADEMDRAGPLGSAWHQLVADIAVGDVLVAVGRDAACRRRLLAWRDKPADLGVLAPTPNALLGAAHLAGGDLAGARRWVDEARTATATVPLASRLAAVAHVDAELLLAEGRVAEAVEQARLAAEQYARCHYQVHEAQARVTLAEALLRDRQVSASRAELGRARQHLAHTGASWLAEQAARAQRRAAARLPRPGRPVGVEGPLTAREREVAELAAQGLTNRAIAARLYLSQRTVDAHLARILGKLGVSSRAAIARRLD
jgi:DNA-binding NarL/FixJ family response regulator